MSRVPRQEQIEEKRQKKTLHNESCELGKKPRGW